jgi:hypothetical protein
MYVCMYVCTGILNCKISVICGLKLDKSSLWTTILQWLS